MPYAVSSILLFIDYLNLTVSFLKKEKKKKKKLNAKKREKREKREIEKAKN